MKVWFNSFKPFLEIMRLQQDTSSHQLHQGLDVSLLLPPSKTYGIKEIFNDLELKDWSNIKTLITKDTTATTAEKSFRKYTDSFTKINRHSDRYPLVNQYTNQVKAYLLSVKDTYVDEFEERVAKKQKSRSKRAKLE